MSRKLILIIALALNVLVLSAQETQPMHAVYGRLYTLNKIPVNGMVVKSKNLGCTVQTDSLGRFSMVCAEKDILLINGKPFKPQKIKVNKNQTDSLIVKLNFPLTEKNIDIAVGYGYISETRRTAAISCLPKNRDYCEYSNIYDLLSENFSSLSVNGDCITIRGGSSYGKDECALLVVDGRVMQTISDVTPCSIKNISVIKDASTAIYGSRGGNGAIVITLKRGGD